MALNAYYKLKEKKKNMILMAIASCLKEQKYDEFSVNHIAYEAGIARGSFYNYFEDKYDAVYTFVESQFYVLENLLKNSILKCNGSLFEGIKMTRQLNNDYITKDNNFEILKNIDFFMGIIIKIIYSENYSIEIDKLLDWLIENTIEGKDKLNDRESMANVLELLVSLFLYEIARMVTNKQNSKTYDNFELKLNIIKNGVCKMA